MGTASSGTEAEEPSRKEVLRNESARQAGRERCAQGSEGHAERGGEGAGRARARSAWMISAPSGSKRAFEPHPQGFPCTQKLEGAGSECRRPPRC